MGGNMKKRTTRKLGKKRKIKKVIKKNEEKFEAEDKNARKMEIKKNYKKRT